MNKATRMLVMTGMAIVAGATFSAGPAAAASASPAASDSKAATQSAGHGDRSKIVGVYRDPFTCNKIGRFGEIRNKWDDYRCIRVPGGFHRSKWALRVSWDRHGGWGGNHGGWGDHDGWGDGHDGWGDGHDGWGNDHDGWGNDHDGPGGWNKH
ncbi:hypothetical protein ACIA5D_12865 [Actinoplanes sp. NPDC051513]|uniref:hypothetical protein n=1 Tax=Actinoplanes sp. NPDC051513 TaxID=3363908 RepID=UPI00378B97CB